MNHKPSISWEELEKELEITPEQEKEIQLEKDRIRADIAAREKLKTE